MMYVASPKSSPKERTLNTGKICPIMLNSPSPLSEGLPLEERGWGEATLKIDLE